jgi:hypothetical protein
MNYDINLVPVLFSAIVFMIVGSLWYGPFFGKKWMQLVNRSSEQMKGMNRTWIASSMLITFISALITSYVFAVLLKSLLITTISGALTLACLAWLGFVVTSFSHRVLFERNSPRLYVLNALQYLVSYVLGILVLVLWPW